VRTGSERNQMREVSRRRREWCAQRTLQRLSELRLLDTSDPGTQAYIKAMDKKTFDTINDGATKATIVSPVGTIGSVAGFVGPASSLATGYIEGQEGKAAIKETLQLAAQAYLDRVFGVGEAAASRIVALVDLNGGWQAFVDRAQEEIRNLKDRTK